MGLSKILEFLQLNKPQHKSSEGAQENIYTVKKGDTLYSVAKSLGVSVEDLKKANGLKDNSLSVGQNIRVPSKANTVIFSGTKAETKGIQMYKEISDEELKIHNVKNIKNTKDVAKSTGLSEGYLNELKKMEEVHYKPYKDINGNSTIGIGHVIKPEEVKKYSAKTLSEAEVNELLAKDLLVRQKNIKAIIGEEAYKKMPQPVKESVVDLVFSRGETMFREREGLVDALKKGNYGAAISKMDIDYSIIKDKNGKKSKKFLSGLNKRRLFEMSHASKIYKGNIPPEVMNSANKVYRRGLYFLAQEAEKNDSIKKAYPNIKEEYNNLTKQWFNNKIKLVE